MSLEIGASIGPYEITAHLGAGGMGEVYRATDTKLKRDVAIKVLPAHLSRDPDRLARFEREARVLASLNHPNIAAIFGLEDSGDVRCLVLELVEGETLAGRLGRGPLAIDDALDITRQIATALESAHEKGIIHRDLKPANVKIAPDGTVKVLDFGLAKALREEAPEGGSEASLPPTITAGGTRDGMILGTAPYMSPEQARGRPVDRRTDIWSLGCVLFECLTGRGPFEGPTTTDVLARIVSHDPDFDSLPRETPECIVRLLRRCLDKDAARRLRDAGEARVLIEEFTSNPRSAVFGPAPAPAAGGRLSSRLIPWGVALVLGILLGVLVIGRAPRPAPHVPISHWSIALPPGGRVALPSPGGGFDYSRTVAVSRDGSRIAFSVQDDEDRTEMYLKTDAPQPQPIPGAANARGPFFSPDGQWLGFYANDTNAIYKVALNGGSPQKICDIERTIAFDASWSPDGETILFSTDDGLWRVASAGGTPDQLTVPDGERGEVGHYAPRYSADGRGVFFTVSVTPETHLAYLSPDRGTWEIILENASLGVEVNEDLLVFARSGELLAARWDPATRRIEGSAIPVLQGVETTPGLGGMVLTQFDVSGSGALVYAPAARVGPDRLIWVNENGDESEIASGPGTWVHPRLSPDERRISLDIHSHDGMRDVHIYEPDRGQFRQLTRTGLTWESEWRPDGERLAVLSGAPAGQWSLFWVRTDFSGPADLLHRSSHIIPGSWLPDGRSLLYSEWVEGGIWRITPGADTDPVLIMQTGAQEGFPRLSPDGKWMAFVEAESGRRDVFVHSFPDPGAKHKVSIDGGGEPVWAHDGRRLFYRKGDQMFAVEVRDRPTLGFGRPRVLFSGKYDAAAVGHQHYDVSRDGRFLMIRHGDRVGPHEVRVVLDWAGQLERLLASP